MDKLAFLWQYKVCPVKKETEENAIVDVCNVEKKSEVNENTRGR